jgi:zinc transport system substrate-binding protein
MMARTAMVILLCSILVLSGCGDGEESAPAEPATGPLSVYTVNYPLAYLAERIGGDRVRVEFPAPPDVDPAFWSPDTETVAAYQQADLILLNGAGYAKWVAKVTLPATQMVDTSQALADDLIVETGGVTHSHGPGGEHTHGEVAFTTWLDADIAQAQARAIRDGFVAARPVDQAVFDDGLSSLEADLASLDGDLRVLIGHDFRKPLLGSHPVYQYLARRYGLDLRMVHFEPDEMPSAEQWRDLEVLVEEHPAEWMLWEAAPLPEIVDRLRRSGVESVVFDPCGNRPESGDFLSVMRGNVERLRVVFDPGDAGIPPENGG